MREVEGFHPRCEYDERAHLSRLQLELTRMQLPPPRLAFFPRLAPLRFDLRRLLDRRQPRESRPSQG
jgi:hypothetical protein